METTSTDEDDLEAALKTSKIAERLRSLLPKFFPQETRPNGEWHTSYGEETIVPQHDDFGHENILVKIVK
jgi:hypothetical protein